MSIEIIIDKSDIEDLHNEILEEESFTELNSNADDEEILWNIENTQNSISSSMDEKKSNDVNPSISSNECKDATGNELRKSGKQ